LDIPSRKAVVCCVPPAFLGLFEERLGFAFVLVRGVTIIDSSVWPVFLADAPKEIMSLGRWGSKKVGFFAHSDTSWQYGLSGVGHPVGNITASKGGISDGRSLEGLAGGNG
jgi:hypothetical protein